MYGIGIARHEDADQLRAAGADIVVSRLDTIDVHAAVDDVPADRSPTSDVWEIDLETGHP
jgi:hypothetical protein